MHKIPKQDGLVILFFKSKPFSPCYVNMLADHILMDILLVFSGVDT